jgi:hypothetical protein
MRAGIERAVALGWLWKHESGTYLQFTDIEAAVSLRASSPHRLRQERRGGAAGLQLGQDADSADGPLPVGLIHVNGPREASLSSLCR